MWHHRLCMCVSLVVVCTSVRKDKEWPVLCSAVVGAVCVCACVYFLIILRIRGTEGLDLFSIASRIDGVVGVRRVEGRQRYGHQGTTSTRYAKCE